MATRHFVAAGGIFAVTVVLAGFALLARRDVPGVKDYTNANLKDLHIELIAPKEDPKTGFVVGGKNTTRLIKSLKELNGIAIADLERVMRPQAISRAGFLGNDEQLLEVMARDNDYVIGELRLTHQNLARHLHLLGVIGMIEQGAEFTYHGVRFKAGTTETEGFQDSPFNDGTKTNSDATVTNLDNSKTLRFSRLVPFMIDRYGFYEGKGTRYRLDPEEAIEVLTFLKPKARK